MSLKLSFLPLFFFILLISVKVRAELFPPLSPALQLPRLTVYDEQDQVLTLPGEVQSRPGSVFFLLPVFTKCQSSCPLLVRTLREALAARESQARALNIVSKKETESPKYFVLLLDFDEADRATDLRHFRREQKIPDSWRLVRASDAGAVRTFLDAFQYSLFTADKGFTHPSVVFVFNSQLIWVGSLFGSSIQGEDIQGAWQTAADSEKKGIFASLKRRALRLENAVILGTVGVGFSFFVLLFLLLRRRPFPTTKMMTPADGNGDRSFE